MKKIVNLLLTLSLVFCVFLALPFNASAASITTQDGLEVTITTDKTEYTVGEDILVSVNIKNNNSYKVENVSIQTLLPEGLVLTTGNLSATDIDIDAGTSYTASIVAQLSEEVKDSEKTEPDGVTNPDDATKPNDIATSDNDGEISSPQTRDNLNIVLWIVLLIISIAGIFLRLKYKKTAKILSLFLCLAMVLNMFPLSAFAIENGTTIIVVDKTITIAGKEYVIKTNVIVPNDSDSSNCVVTFNTNGGSEVESQTITKGSTVTMPVVPEKDGFVFVGWYTDNEYTELFDFLEPVSDSCTVFARWVNITDTTDTDGDGLPDTIEEYYETNPSLVDTDKDGLNDYVEIAVINYNPLSKDTDNDGILDGQEDCDNDGIDNKTEIEIGTDPSLVDTDGDDLEDMIEIGTYRTNPLVADTDNDGANDGWEIENGFDPLVLNDSFSVEIKSAETIEENNVVASVKIDVTGSQASSLKVQSVSNEEEPLLSESIPGYLGTAYDFSIDGNITSATISFSYDTSLGNLSDEFQPRIYYFNEESGTLEELENQTVNNGSVSVTVSHFSKYILLNKIEFDKVWENEIKPPLSSGNPEDETSLDIVFVIDYSLSMEQNDKYQLFKSLSEEFVNKLRDGKDKAGAVKFIKKATLVSELTTDKESVINAINGISYDSGYGTYSGTDGSAGIKMALDQMATSNSEYQYIVFITDGEDNGYSYSYDSLIATANESNVTIYAVGMGSASESVLKKVSSQTGGKYYHATTGVSVDDLINLDEVFEDIESETIDLTTDSNNDKIPDYYNDLIKEGILLLSNGSDQFAGIDFNLNADYDGDGILNGDEICIIQSGSVVYLEMKSDPTNKDTDSDGYVDGEDHNISMWDVSYRDLALLAKTVYENYAAGTILSSKKYEVTVNGYGLTGSTYELKGWKVIESVYNPITGFEAAAYAKDNNIVIAMRGSEANDLLDIVQDWVVADVIGHLIGLNAQLPAMETFIFNLVARYGDLYDNFYVTGHSLGGYLALMSSSQLVKHNVKDKIKGVLTFNGLGLSSGIGSFLDIDDNINFLKIKSVIKNYRTDGDVVSCIGYTPGKDITVNQAASLGKWSIDNAHSLVTFIERFSNERRKPNYMLSEYCGLNDEK